MLLPPLHSQVAPTKWSGDAPPPRTGRDGSGALVLQTGEVPPADRQSGGWAGRRLCQHARGPPHNPGPVLPPSDCHVTLFLRHQEATSSLQEMGPGTSFSPVLGDEIFLLPLLPWLPYTRRVSRVVLCCGKHYYPLAAHRRQLGREDDIAIVRLEQLCPFPSGAIHSHLARFPSARGEGERMTGVRNGREREREKHPFTKCYGHSF
jgi:hypothetical protein